MPITFGSVGDIISLCSVIQKLAKALDDARGSLREYQDLVEELRALEIAIKEVKRLSDENSDVLELGPLFQTAGRGAAQCQQDLEGFLESISKYGRYFQGGSGSVIKGNIAKARWQITQRDELIKFRAHIGAHARSMSVLLSALNINVAFLHKAQLERSINEARQTSEDAVAEQRNVFHNIRGWCQWCEAYFTEATRLLRGTAHNLLQGLEWLRHSTSEIKDGVHQIFVLNFQMYGEIIRVQSFMTTYLERASSLASEAPWVLEDCIGRVSPVHKQFIISIIEESDDSQSECEIPLGLTQKVIRSRVERKVKRRKYRPWFLGKERETPKRIPQTPPKVNRKRRWDDYESSESEQDHAAFKRIRLVSPRHYLNSEHRRKRVCLYGPRKREENQTPNQSNKAAISLTPSALGRDVPNEKIQVLAGPQKEQEVNTSEPRTEESPFEALDAWQQKSKADETIVESECNDSAFESDTCSLSSLVTDYEHFCGRRYHAYGTTYLRPNDEHEQDTEDFLHHVFFLVLGKRLYLAPLKHAPKRILDVGTGTGTWPIDVADELHPEAIIQGIDISPIQPAFVPPNVTFRIDDIFLTGGPGDWDAKPKYDLVHCRNLCTAVRDWRALIDGAYRSLRPGGFLEVQELVPFPFSYATDAKSAQDKQIGQHLCDAYAACGIDLQAPLRLPNVLREAGFKDVKVEVICVSLDSKELRLWLLGWFKEVLDGLTNKPFQQGLGWSDENRKLYIAEFLRSWRLKPLAERRAYFKFVIVYGLKE